ncbi:RNA polymerase II transcriptional coactivator [Cordyceps fumosorosea ARSEF 2679]|uniref:RNA polymerase II transcriptional coactivator n=1 Tax=Cordyceps fumosorosea (strain ARSEF 2679) TaxID=1081104 RepID=A0A168CM79_CORFA|nr:RNA polymerase II transcriptional coactivator [Cordyceps fumosorosea ARSEF 2679]OAA71550.1 RNA polymerase II transcriptional coactivator [Cordyceps fumosorosea ARSEF 2679]
MGNKRRASVAEPSDGSDAEVTRKVSKKNKTSGSVISPAGKDDDGNPFWELSNKRRVGVSQYQNRVMINIREYYDKDGKALPGKKGISLLLDQYLALVKLVPSINGKLREMGQVVDTADNAGEDTTATAKKSKKERSDKANIEATSDEDET